MREAITTMSTNPYQIWLEAGGQKLLLPVNPEKIDIKVNGNNQSVTVAELGEVVIPQSTRAMVLSFSSFFPATSFRGCQYAPAETLSTVGDYNGDGVVNVRDLAAKARTEKSMNTATVTMSDNAMKVLPHYCINFILNAMHSKLPVRVCVTKCDILQYMTIESFSYSQGDLDVGDYSYSISFKSYKTVTLKKINVNTSTGKASVSNTVQRVNNTVKPKTYTVKSGDTLCTIAKKYYGYVAAYKKIYEANKKIIGANPNMIKAGMVLTLP